MRHIRFITLLACLSATLFANAAYTLGTVNLLNDGNSIKAEALYDLDGRTVIIGNGQNACISQYTQGTLTIPGEIDIDGVVCSVSVGQLAFRLCNGLTEVVMEEGVTSIGDYAFVGCSALEKVTLPSTMHHIGCGAFVNLSSLKSMTCSASSAPYWEYNDLFAYEGTAEATSQNANKRTLYVPRKCAANYKRTKYQDIVGWDDAFGLISEAIAPSREMEISSYDDLVSLRNMVNNGNGMGDYTIRLTTDLLLGEGNDSYNQWYIWEPIGTADCPFKGIFDGGGHTISGLRMRELGEDGTNVGLFGYTESASIGNLFLRNICMKGSDNVGVVVGHAVSSLVHDVLVYDAVLSTGEKFCCAEATNGCAGGIVGRAEDSEVSDCYFYGQVKGSAAAGGIVGASTYALNVSDCASAYSIESNGVAGGIVGTAEPVTSIARCYSRSTLDGTASAKGAIVGLFSGDSTEEANTISNCAYLDTEGTLKTANADYENAWTETITRPCSTVADMEALKLSDVLGDLSWHYFHSGMSDCPVPASLAEKYQEWVGIKDERGFIYASVDDPAGSYILIGYAGSEKEIVLPATYNGKNVIGIGHHAFKGAAFTSVMIPNGIVTIEEGAFVDCKDLTFLSIGASVASAYNGWLDGCESLAEIRVASWNSTYHAENGVLYDASKKHLIRCATGYSGTLTVPSSVETMSPGAFANCQHLVWADFRETQVAWEVDRKLHSSPFYSASKYTLFIINKSSKVTLGEPNVAYINPTYSETELHCDRLLISEQFGFLSPVTFKAQSVRYDRKFTAGIGYAKADEESEAEYVLKPKGYTVCLPFRPDITPGNGIKVYSLDRVTTNAGVTTAWFDEVGTRSNYDFYNMTANYPYYVVVEGEGTYTLGTDYETTVQVTGGDTGGTMSHDGFVFVGTTSGKTNAQITDAQNPAYILNGDGNWYKVTESQPTASVAPFCCYFLSEAGEPAPDVIVTAFEDKGSPCPTIELIDGEDNSQLFATYGGHKVNVNYNRVLSATNKGNGIWSPRAYTVCLPYDLRLTSEWLSEKVTICTLFAINDAREFIFSHSTDRDLLKAGHPYLVVVNEGTVSLNAKEVTLVTQPHEGQEVTFWSNDMSKDGTLAGHWRGTLTKIESADAAAMFAYSLQTDGTFKRIRPDTPWAWWGAFRSMFCAKEFTGSNVYAPVFHEDNDENPGDGFFTGGGNNSVIGFTIAGFEGDTNIPDGTGIMHVIGNDGSHRLFDLLGRQLPRKPTGRGLYIEDGRIVFSK